MGNMVLAAASYTKAITSLKSVLLTLGSAIGAVMLVYGGIKFAMAFRQMDQQGEHQAVYFIFLEVNSVARDRFLLQEL